MLVSPTLHPLPVKMALAYDEQNLYLAYDYSGDVSEFEKESPKRDARAVYLTNHVELLVD